MSRLKRWFKDDKATSTSTLSHITVKPGIDPERPSDDTDIGRLYNRMNPPGVLGTAYKATGG